MVDYTEAILSLFPDGAGFVQSGQSYSGLEWLDERPKPTEEQLDVELKRLQAEYDAQEYARNRQAEYPDWSVQLNKIYDDGVTKWKSEMVDPIKAKYPKP